MTDSDLYLARRATDLRRALEPTLLAGQGVRGLLTGARVVLSRLVLPVAHAVRPMNLEQEIRVTSDIRQLRIELECRFALCLGVMILFQIVEVLVVDEAHQSPLFCRQLKPLAEAQLFDEPLVQQALLGLEVVGFLQSFYLLEVGLALVHHVFDGGHLHRQLALQVLDPLPVLLHEGCLESVLPLELGQQLYLLLMTFLVYLLWHGLAPHPESAPWVLPLE